MSSRFSHQKKTWVRSLYKQGMQVRDIADKTNIPVYTIHTWAKKESWPNQRCDLCNAEYRGADGETVRCPDYDLYFCTKKCLSIWKTGEQDDS